MDLVALIPCRMGSKRIPNKNLRLLGGQPLVSWTIEAAQEAGIFDRIILSTNDPRPARVAEAHGIKVNFTEDPVHEDLSPDIAWVKHARWLLPSEPHAFAILRPTSPFRSATSIRRAYAEFRRADGADSLRAVRVVSETPYKMWRWDDGPMTPLLTGNAPDGTPWHSTPTQAHPKVYIQSGAMEMAWSHTVDVHGTISGRTVYPFFMPEHESLDLNTMADWARAEAYVAALA